MSDKVVVFMTWLFSPCCITDFVFILHNDSYEGEVQGQHIVGSTRNQCNSCVLVSSSCLSDEAGLQRPIPC